MGMCCAYACDTLSHWKGHKNMDFILHVFLYINEFVCMYRDLCVSTQTIPNVPMHQWTIILPFAWTRSIYTTIHILAWISTLNCVQWLFFGILLKCASFLVSTESMNLQYFTLENNLQKQGGKKTTTAHNGWIRGWLNRYLYAIYQQSNSQ